MTAALRFWVGTPVAHALGGALLHFLWEGSAVAAVLAILLWVTRAARVRYALASAAMAVLPLAFAVTVAITMPANNRFVPPAAPHYRVAAPDTGDSPPVPVPGPDRLSWLAPLWMAGVLLFYARGIAAWMAAQRLRRRGVCTVPAEWQERARELAARLRLSRPVLLLESCLTEIPVTLGCLRPVILLPVGLLTGLAPEQVEAILLHELAHIRRYDYAMNLLQTFVEGLLFYHPAVWWISHVLRTEREHCCDDLVVAHRVDARAYAAALARLEHNRALAYEAAMAASGGHLMRRIRRLLNEPERPRTAVAPMLAIGLLLATVAAGLAWSPQPESPVQHQSKQEQVKRTLVNTYGPKPAAAYKDFVAFMPQQAITPPNPYRKWLNEDVAYIITDEERTAFKRLQTDAEREQFIEQFWLKRDPTPGTVENEFKEEHYRRIAYANQHFSSAIPGWKTDRGRIYIMYGPPDEIDDHASATPTPFKQWRYKYIEGIGKDVIIEFIDPTHTGEYRMTYETEYHLAYQGELPARVFHSPAGGLRINVSVGPKGVVVFDVPFGMAARAYTGTWQLTNQNGSAPQEGQFDARFGRHALNLQPGAYRLSLNLQDPNGNPVSGSVDFTVE
jgi:GWxTD domain-containing protein